MKCPYCAEEIQSKAVICRHCRQILGAEIPERTFPEPNVVSAATPGSPVAVAHLNSPFPAALAAALGVVATTVAFFIQTTVDSESALALSERSFYLTVVLLPTLLGFLVGMTWPGFHLKAYLVSGFGMGICNLLLVSALTTTADSVFNLQWAVLVFVVCQGLLFASSGWIGDELQRLLGSGDPRPPQKRWSDLIKSFTFGLLANVLTKVSVTLLLSP